MAINTTLAGLSTNQALNGPDGATDLPSQYDNAIRYALSFTASLRDGIGFTPGAIVSGLGYTPVQQGTGTSQLTNAVKIGYSASAQLRVQVDATDFGVNWPINVTGSSASCTGNAATSSSCSGNAATASNASLVNGQSFPFANPTNSATYLWASNGTNNNFLVQMGQASVNFANSSGACTGNSNTATLATTASNANALGGIGPGGWVQNTGSVVGLQNTGFSSMNANIGGTTCFWGMSVSDGRLKEAIAPTVEDSLSKVCAIDFVQYRFKRLPGQIQVDDGHLHKVGLIAQQAETIDPDWIVEPEGGHKQPDTYALLMDAMHAIKQLNAKVAALEARLAV